MALDFVGTSEDLNAVRIVGRGVLNFEAWQ